MKKLLILPLILLFIACEDPIEVNTPTGESKINIEAILTTLPGDKKIKVSRTGGFDAISNINYLSNASVALVKGSLADINNLERFEFTWDGVDGYILDSIDVPEFSVGDSLGLIVTLESSTFLALTEIYRVPKIDSLVWEEEGPNDIIFAQFYATDFQGINDFYYPRGYLNGERINETNFTTAFDAAPGQNSGLDGGVLAQPIRDIVTPPFFGDNQDSLVVGDTITAELLAIDFPLLISLNLALAQVNNGGLFATPTTNVPTNIISQGDEEAVGWFAICNASLATAVIDSTAGKVEFE